MQHDVEPLEMNIKLTKPQKAALERIAKGERLNPVYPPVAALAKLGLVDVKVTWSGNIVSVTLAGWDWLNEEDAK
jgi:hypothetical protein